MPTSVHRSEEQRQRRCPKAEVRKDVHHGVQRRGRDGTRRANVRRELHNAIWKPAEAKRRRIAKSETAHRKLIGMTEGETLAMIATIHNRLECARIECIYHHPHADNGGQVHTRSCHPVANVAEIYAEAVEHRANRHEAEDEEYVAVGASHFFSFFRDAACLRQW